MKYIFLLLCSLVVTSSRAGSDTLFVQSAQDSRYRLFLDSMEAYSVGLSVAKSMADTVAKLNGSRALDAYFLSGFATEADSNSGGYFFNFQENKEIRIGHISDEFHGMRDEAKFPWEYLESQYRRLDKVKLQPKGVMMGAELPNVYVYWYPSQIVVVRPVKRFTVIYPGIKFTLGEDGKTKTSYILKYYYSQTGNELQQIDSIVPLDPITHKRLHLPGFN